MQSVSLKNNVLVLKNVDLQANPNQFNSNVDIVIENGEMTGVHSTGTQAFPSNATIVNAEEYIVIPAGVDPQVHMRVPGGEHKETAETAVQAARRGGILATLQMPNTTPVLDNVEAFRFAQSLLEPVGEQNGVKVLISAAVTKQQRGRDPVDFVRLANAGAAAFTDDGYGVATSRAMHAGFRGSADTCLPLLQHAETPGHGGLLHEGRTQKRLGIPAYPGSAESSMVQRDIEILRDYPTAKYHVLHVTSHLSVNVIKDAKQLGLPITAEVSPHHLWFTSNDIPEYDTNFKMNPPLRNSEDRDSLRDALRYGLIDCVATDHAPHAAHEKGTNFKTAAYGTTGLETSLRVLYSLWKSQNLSLGRLVDAFSLQPSKLLQLQPSEGWGELRVGSPFRGLLLDKNSSEKTITTSQLRSLSQNNCFLGSRLPDPLAAVIEPTLGFLPVSDS